jgi:hypothetical protein
VLAVPLGRAARAEIVLGHQSCGDCAGTTGRIDDPVALRRAVLALALSTSCYICRVLVTTHHTCAKWPCIAESSVREPSAWVAGEEEQVAERLEQLRRFAGGRTVGLSSGGGANEVDLLCVSFQARRALSSDTKNTSTTTITIKYLVLDD